MKNFLFSICILSCSVQSLMAQNMTIAASNNCNSPFFVSSNTHSLIDSYRDLITKTGIITCHYDATNDYNCVTSAMASKGYNNGCYDVNCSKKVYGYVNFTSLIHTKHPNPIEEIAFHTVWAAKSTPNSAGYEALICPEAIPTIVVYPFSVNNTQNHVFEALLVPIAAYKTAVTKAFSPALKKIAIKPVNIKSINDVYMECASDYINQKEPQAYQNPMSSKGIVCDVTLNNGTKVAAYIINNYDEAGTLLWKVKKK